MKMLKTLFCWTALLACPPSPSAAAQANLEASLPVDSAVAIQTLPNGLRYYIRENQKPENRALFRLVVNAGSLMETEAQLGLAHFLEHMAFNGTENFEKLELVNFLERVGMRFGSHLNAYTSFDETVYMLEVPADDEEVVATAFQVLRDWMQGIQFDPEEIDKERGVVIEEWRSGRGAQGRLNDKQLPVIFYGSRYAERLPIGKVEIIENIPREQFIDFYRKWYRPNLTALVPSAILKPPKSNNAFSTTSPISKTQTTRRRGKTIPFPTTKKPCFPLKPIPNCRPPSFKSPTSAPRRRKAPPAPTETPLSKAFTPQCSTAA